MACFIHKWDGCTCTKCGKIRASGHAYNEEGVCSKCGQTNPAIACEKCGKSKGDIDRKEKEKRDRLKAMGAGIVLDMSADGLMRCPNCKKIACTKCALELPGHDIKTCPFCNTDYDWNSIV